MLEYLEAQTSQKCRPQTLNIPLPFELCAPMLSILLLKKIKLIFVVVTGEGGCGLHANSLLFSFFFDKSIQYYLFLNKPPFLLFLCIYIIYVQLIFNRTLSLRAKSDMKWRILPAELS